MSADQEKCKNLPLINTDNTDGKDCQIPEIENQTL
jgi:hypothetical protein